MMKDERLRTLIAETELAIASQPGRADLQVKLGTCLDQAGERQAALACYRRALQIDPSSYAAYNNIGNSFAALGDTTTAIIFLQAAVTLNPNLAEIHNNIGNAFLKQERVAEAIESYRRATILKPKEATYFNHLGNALRVNTDYVASEMWLRRALTLRPGYAEAHVNLGLLFFEQNLLAEAEDCYRDALRCQPDYAQAHVSLSQLLLRRGELDAGWKEQEWRWQWKDFPSPKRNFTRPQWRGEALNGATILLHAEQGFGDTIQFLRYVPMVEARGATVILEVHPELQSLAASLAPPLADDSRILSREDPLPAFAWHCPLMSLPLAFSTELNNIPANIPYLRANAQALDGPRPAGGQLKVGIAWAGNPKNERDRQRSLPGDLLAPLFDLGDVSFYSLQRGALSTAHLPWAGGLPQSGDFAVTAAFITQLDLVIAVDTAVAHLAGALGRPVWVLLAKPADWRWLIDREDSPWYPTARLFRQDIAGDWESVLTKVADELQISARGGELEIET